MIINFETLQKDFTSRSNELKNKGMYIEEELNQIDYFINHKNYTPQPTSPLGITNKSYRSKIEILNKIYNDVRYGWDTFIIAYNEFCYNEKETEFKEFIKDSKIPEKELKKLNEQYQQYHKQGLEFGKYTLWLGRPKNKPTTEKEYSDLSPGQKLLALHYLGLDFRDFTNTHVANVLSQILNVGPENIRKNLSKIYGGKNDLRNITNFEKLTELFENKTFESISNKLKREIKELN